MANSVDADQAAPLGAFWSGSRWAVWSGSALFAQAYLSRLHVVFYLSYLLNMFNFNLVPLTTFKPIFKTHECKKLARQTKRGSACALPWKKMICLNGPRQANLVLIAYASSEGSGEPAHPRSLARTFASRSYKQSIKRNLQTESQIPDLSEWLGMRC